MLSYVYKICRLVYWFQHFPTCKLGNRAEGNLKVQSCKLYNNKYMITSTKIVNPKIFAFIVVLVLKLMSRKFLFYKQKRQ